MNKHTNTDQGIFTIKLKGQTPAFLLDSKNKMYLIYAFIFSNPLPSQVLCNLNVKIISFKAVLEQMD